MYESHASSVNILIDKFINHTIIIYGDYNLPEINWNNDDSELLYSYTSTTRAPCIPELFATHSFYQMNSSFNAHGSLLDLVFTCNKLLIVNKSLEPAVPIDPYHQALCIYLSNSPSSTPCDRSKSFFNFNKADYLKISSFLGSFDWYSTFHPLDIDSAFNTFYDALHQPILDFVPKCSFRKSTYPPWYSHELKQVVALKKKAHARFKSSLSSHDYIEFSFLRAKFKYLSKKCFRKYSKHADSSLTSNPKKFWQFINSSRCDHKDIPRVVSLNGTSSCNEHESAEKFSSYFSSVYSSKFYFTVNGCIFSL
ncbi:hypothetical protein ACI65C_005019 [Semiaphis heraclei]